MSEDKFTNSFVDQGRKIKTDEVSDCAVNNPAATLCNDVGLASGMEFRTGVDSMPISELDTMQFLPLTKSNGVTTPLILRLGTTDDEESPCPSSYTSPVLSPTATHSTLIKDGANDFTETNFTLIDKSEKLHLDDTLAGGDGVGQSHVEPWVIQPVSSEDERGEPPTRKARKNRKGDTPSSGVSDEEAQLSAFDAAAAISTSSFVFRKFGSDVSSIFTFTASPEMTVPNDVLQLRPTAVVTAIAQKGNGEANIPRVFTLATPTLKHVKEPALSMTFPAKTGGMELKIITQPEDQHRARYMTEGSRGAVKDMTGQGHPVIKLFGHLKPAILQVFIGTDSGKVRPHGFYQACKVCGKSTSNCQERDMEGTVVIDIELLPDDDMQATIDCVGILKLRNADVEQRIGVARSKKKSTRVRMIFRINIPKADGSFHTLQVASHPINCTQPAGQPEISKKSLSESGPSGGQDLFVIGKNFSKGTRVYFKEIQDSAEVWSKEAEMDKEYFQTSHFICKIPAYHDLSITEKVEVQVIIDSGGRVSEPHMFTYTPGRVIRFFLCGHQQNSQPVG